MQKLWNWIIDKKSHQIRKWYSTVFGGGASASASASGTGATNSPHSATGSAQQRQRHSSTVTSSQAPTTTTATTARDASSSGSGGGGGGRCSERHESASKRSPTPTPPQSPAAAAAAAASTSRQHPSSPYRRVSAVIARVDAAAHRRRRRRRCHGHGHHRPCDSATSSMEIRNASATDAPAEYSDGDDYGVDGDDESADDEIAHNNDNDDGQSEQFVGLDRDSCVNFEQFFDESASAIRIALEQRASGSTHSASFQQHYQSGGRSGSGGGDESRKCSIQPRPVEPNERFGDTLSVENRHLNRRSESARLADHPTYRPRVRLSSAKYDYRRRADKTNSNESESDDFVERKATPPHTILKSAIQTRSPLARKRCSLPQVSVSFADNPSTSTIIFEERIVEEDEDEQRCHQHNANNNDGQVSSKKGSSKEDIRKDSLWSLSERRKSLDGRKNCSISSTGSKDDDERRRLEQLQLRRQSNIQYVQAASGRRTSTTLLPLTSAQIHLIRTLWRQIYITKGPTVIGTTLFHRIFFKSLKIKEQFRTCPTPQHYPNHDCFAKAHCKAVAELIDRIVENLDNLESVSDELIRIGTIHAQILDGQLSGKMWNLAAETFIDCTLEWGDRRCRTETVRKAWALIIAFTFEKVKEGHALERRYQSQMRLSTISSNSTNVSKRQQ